MSSGGNRIVCWSGDLCRIQLHANLSTLSRNSSFDLSVHGEATDSRPIDVVVVGGGNAGLCAAIAARSCGAQVVLLERSSKWERGGNSKYTRNVRCVREGLYTEDEFVDDMRSVSDADMPLDLLRLLVRRSVHLPDWLESQGVRWQRELQGTIQLGRTNRFFLGGGKALVNVLYRRAETLGVRIDYDTQVIDVVPSQSGVVVKLRRGVDHETIAAGAAVIACGGYEANLEWLEAHLGKSARRYAVRGTRFNDGALLGALCANGAATRGIPGRAHAVAVDDRCPQFDAGIVSRVDSIPFGIVVDRTGRRFADEGQDIWPKRYASWGQLIAARDEQIAFSIFERRYRGRFIPPLHPPIEAGSIRELASKLQLDPDRVDATVAEFNAATPDVEVSDLTRLDGRSTRGLIPPKSNWASSLREPPFCAYPLRPGITFTYFSLAVNEQAQVISVEEEPVPGLYTAGEAIAGNFLSKGYLAGVGMAIGGVFGLIAGEEAAIHARRAK